MKIKLLTLVLLISSAIFSQDKVTISGTIKDKKSTETLTGVNIFVEELKIGTSTNEYGFYSITLPPGQYRLKFSYVGFDTYEQILTIKENYKFDYELTETSKTLQEVIVTTNKKATDIRSSEMSVNKLSIQTIKKIPVVLGEVDIIKSILQLPGVNQE